ncbi:MAG TPA: LuxR C-terminal-related transcriptional regulator [Roseiflexaceae bacterium]|nr:LuxR C-terminal-related transcriptional regulator [Roseiflexaceae bacterium]
MDAPFDDLLVTKLALPPLRAALVERPRLLARLHEGLRGPLTLVSAPAGFGKTTLLASCLRATQLEARPTHQALVAWLALDAGDNDPVRFWRYLIAALERQRPGVGGRALQLLPGSADRLSEAALTALINGLAELTRPIVLALDDYHLIDEPLIHAGLTFLLDHMPASLRLVIASRTTPPLPLERLRVRGQVVELDAASLRFTPDEATQLLNRVMGLALPPEAVGALAERTEGWGAGLLLAALSLRGRPDPAPFIAAFSGAHRAVLDYIAAEVLERQPPEIQRFLLHTAVLDRMCAELCDAVMERLETRDLRRGDSQVSQAPSLKPQASGGDLQASSLKPQASQVLLEGLERANLFVVPLDEERRWYRYHQLFADVLRERLRQRAPELLPELHRRAARWYAAQGLCSEAVEHALAAGDWAMAAPLIAQTGRDMLLRSELTTLRNWLDALPPDQLRAHPRLCLMDGWFLVLAGLIDQAEQLLAHVEWLATDPDIPPDPELPDEMLMLGMTIGALRGTHALLEDLPERVIARLQQNPFMRSIAALLAGYPHAFRGDIGLATQAFERAVQIGRESGSPLIVLLALCQLAELQMILGRLHQAAATYEQAHAELAQHQRTRLPLEGLVLIGQGELARERNELLRAELLLNEGLAYSAPIGEFNHVDGYVSLARLALARGDTARAEALAQRAADLADRLNISLLGRVARSVQARLWIATGNLAQARLWAADAAVQISGHDQRDDNWAYLLVEIEQLTRVRLLNAQGCHREALAVLEWLLASTGERMRNRIDGLIQRAIALDSLGQTAAAIDCLGEALALAEPEGYARLFLDEGHRLGPILRDLAGRDAPMSPYAAHLLEMLRREPARTDGQAAGEVAQAEAGDGEPAQFLSPRELEVLRLIADGMSNNEIAVRLVVAQSTVKKHVHNIFSKLGAQSRTRALVRARELGLL